MVLLTSIAAPLPPTSAARAGNIRKFDRMRFVECMVLDTVKPLYLKVNEVMTRYELDGRNSRNANNDFYDQICCEFNNSSFVPMS